MDPGSPPHFFQLRTLLCTCSCGEVETTLAAASTRMVVLGCLLANPEYSDLINDSEEEEHDWSEQSSVARLVNAMASLRRGRNYLGEYYSAIIRSN